MKICASLRALLQSRAGLALALVALLACLWGGWAYRAAPVAPSAEPALLALAPDLTATASPDSSRTLAPAPTATNTRTAMATLTLTLAPAATTTALPTPAATRTRIPTPSLTATVRADPSATTDVPGSLVAKATAMATATPMPIVVSGPTVPVADRYRIGGLDLSDGQTPLSIAYPASLDGPEMTRYDGLTILPVDFDGSNYRRFVTEYDSYVFVYTDALSGSVVLNVHDGTLRSSGRALEAEPLRRLIEGDLHSAYALDVIQSNLNRLVGREWVLAQNGHEARFRLVSGHRMSARDVAHYSDRASQLSAFIGGIPDPQRSLLFFFCSGRQPGEPSGSFVGRYVLLLELVD